jgi:hypothetical protein
MAKMFPRILSGTIQPLPPEVHPAATCRFTMVNARLVLMTQVADLWSTAGLHLKTVAVTVALRLTGGDAAGASMPWSNIGCKRLS